jgi:peptidoglycan hydrolase-like protein with peptidoglycan-binding domain
MNSKTRFCFYTLSIFTIFLFSFFIGAPHTSATPPSVTPLGDNTIDYTLPSTCPSVACDRGDIYGTQINFIVDDSLDAQSKTTVEEAVSAGASTVPRTYVWYNNSLRIYSSSPIIFDDDVIVTVTDIDSDEGGEDIAESIENLLIIDSSEDSVFSFLFAGGTGIELDPFQIETCEELQNINYYADVGYSFILNNDIDCSETSTWNSDGEGWYYGFDPIGGIGLSFAGYLNGNNHIIQGLYINRPNNNSATGLFESIYGVNTKIANIGLMNVDITGNNGVGSITGYSCDYALISNSFVSGGTVSGNGSYIGGLVGDNGRDCGHEAFIENSYAVVSITGTGNRVGGLVGTNKGEITNSYATGDVEGFDSVGGLVGYNEDNEITNSYSTGDVVGNFDIGGLVGASYTGYINNTYATGNINGVNSIGGLVGSNQNGTIQNSYATGNVNGSGTCGDCGLGGLAGNDYNDGIIRNSYSTGNVTASGLGQPVGGLIGYLQGNSADTSYLSNLGWYKSQGNSNISGIGLYSFVGSIMELGQEEPPVIEHPETDNTLFYSKFHPIYTTGENAWDFNTVWHEYTDDYPKFTEQEVAPVRRTRSSGSYVTRTPILSQPLIQQPLVTAENDNACLPGYLYNPLNGRPCPVSSNNPQLPTNINPNSNNTPLNLNLTRNLKLLIPRLEGEDVRQLQNYLNSHGYDCGIVDGVFGTKTAQAVTLFQIANGLTPDGKVGPTTLNLINNLNSQKFNDNSKNITKLPIPTIRTLELTIPRMEGEDVRQLQTYLNNHGYDCGVVDGVFGSGTERVVRIFQITNELVPDGKVGPKMREIIK